MSFKNIEDRRAYYRKRYKDNPSESARGSARWRAKHLEEARRRGRAQYTKHAKTQNEKQKLTRQHPEVKWKMAIRTRRHEYNITPEQYDALVLDAAGFCPACSRQDDNTWRYGLVIDHDHTTDVIRGLVCGTCNRALGYVEKYGLDAQWLTWASSHVKIGKEFMNWDDCNSYFVLATLSNDATLKAKRPEWVGMMHVQMTEDGSHVK